MDQSDPRVRPAPSTAPVSQRSSSRRKSEADHNLDDHDPVNLTVSKSRTFSARVKAPTDALILLRFLLAKIVYRRDVSVLSVAEQFLINESWLVLKRCKDLSFWRSHSKQVEQLQRVNALRRMTLNPSVDHTLWWETLECETGIPSRHAYFGWWKSFEIKRWFRTSNSELKSKTSPKRFIGVGYRDHGTARDSARDGSPSWQEVVGARLYPDVETGTHLSIIPFVP